MSDDHQTGDHQMNEETAMPKGEQTVDESVSHYKVEKLADGRVKVSSGGSVSIAETYYKALQNFAEWQQEHLEERPDHLREDQLNSIYHDTVNPETEDVLENDAEWIRDEVVADVLNGGTDICRSGAWLAERRSEQGDEVLGDRINVYRLWDVLYAGMEDGNE